MRNCIAVVFLIGLFLPFLIKVDDVGNGLSDTKKSISRSRSRSPGMRRRVGMLCSVVFLPDGLICVYAALTYIALWEGGWTRQWQKIRGY